MGLNETMERCPVLPVWGVAVLGALLLSCFWATAAQADEWNDTFREPREFIVTQIMTARSGPGNTYEAMGIVPEGTSIWVTDITNGWHCFKLIDGRSAYIYRRYLTLARKEQETSAAAKAEKKQPKGAEKRPDKSRTEKAKAQAPKKSEAKPEAKAAAESDGDYDEPIVHSSTEIETETEPEKESGAAQEETTDAPVISQDPPEPPLLAEIPQGPEDEPVPPEKVEKSPEDAEEAVRPEKRPVRSSSFGSDGCSDYQRVSFKPGSSETLLKGSLATGKRLCYRFLGIEGNTVSLALQPADAAAVLDVYTPASGHIAEKQKSFSWRCVSTGDKVIVVHADKAATYSLQVKVQR